MCQTEQADLRILLSSDFITRQASAEPQSLGRTRAYSRRALHIGTAQMKFSSRFECVKDWRLDDRLFHGTREDGGGHRVHIPTGTCGGVVVSPHIAIVSVWAAWRWCLPPPTSTSPGDPLIWCNITPLAAAVADSRRGHL
jgi:hypothetical protein